MIEIRLMREVDVEQILKIAHECNLSVWSREDYENEIGMEHSYLSVAMQKDSKRVIGFMSARYTSEETLKHRIYNEADILNIGVLADYRKQGIGTLLLKKFLLNAGELKLKTVWLEVRKSNIKAYGFYRSNGFIEVQTRSKFYTHPLEDALVMKLQIEKNYHNSN